MFGLVCFHCFICLRKPEIHCFLIALRNSFCLCLFSTDYSGIIRKYMELDLTVTGLHKSAAFYLPNHLLLKRDVCIFHFLMIYDYECSLVEKSESERKSCLIDLFCCLQNMPYGYVRYQKRSGFRKKGDEQFSTSCFSFVSSWLNNRWRMHLTLFSCKWWLIFRYLHAAWLGRKHLLVIGN